MDSIFTRKHTLVFALFVFLGLVVLTYSKSTAFFQGSQPPAQTSAQSSLKARASAAASSAIAFVAGIAPTGHPGGFEVEGSLQANTPTANTSDWVPGVAGTGTAVLTAAGVPVDSSKTFHLVDPYDSSSDNAFTGGSKLNDNPNTMWAWTTSKPTAKSDMNNGLLTLSNDSNGHLWATIATDRLSTNGNSYVDFEFLQKTLTANAGGSFTSAGTDGGRTVGDLSLTLELTNGGTQPTFTIMRWQAVGPGFDYVSVMPAAGTNFSASNIGGAVPVSFSAFGAMSYPQFAFAEGSLDVTALIANLNPCLGVKTVFIKTKSSQSASANLEDFFDPIQLNTGTLPTADAGPATVTQCQTVPGPTVFNLTGTITNGTPSWSVQGTTGGASAVILNGTTLTPTVNVTGTGTVTVRLTTTSAQCGNATDDIVLTVTPAPTATAGVASNTVCATSPIVQLNGSVTGAPGGIWSSSGTGTFNPNAATLNGTYTPSAADIMAGTVTLTLTTSGGTCGTAQDSVVITIQPAAVANAGVDQTVCASSPAVTLAGSVSGSATSGTWSGGAGTFNPNATTLNATYTPSAGEITAGTVTLTLTTNDPNGPCGAVSDQVTITINPVATVEAGPNQTVCSASPQITLAGSFGGGATSATWSGGTGTFNPDSMTLNAVYTPSAAEITAGTVTLTLTTNAPNGPCGAVSDTVTFTINAAATANAGSDQTVCSSSPTVTLAGSVGGGASTGTWSGGTGTFNPNNTTLNAMYTPSAAEITAGTVTLILTTNDPNGPCGTANDTVTITINPAATVNAGAAQTVCATSPTVTLNGSLGGGATSATWGGGAGTFNPNNTTLNTMYTPSAGEIAAGSVTLTLTTNDPTGPCGAVSSQVTITINPAATVNAGADQTVCASSPNVTLAGAIGGGASSAMWTTSGTGTFSPNATTLNATYIPSAADITAGMVTLTLTTNDPVGPCVAAVDSMLVTIRPLATANAGADIMTCASSPTVMLGGAVGGSATGGVWSGGAGIFVPNNMTLNASYTPTAAEILAGTVILTLTTTGPCATATDTVMITIGATASASAGADQTVCASSPSVLLAGSIGGAPSGIWSGGAGTFAPSNTALNATYTPTAGEIAFGSVTLTLSTVGGSCGTGTDTMTIFINPAATVNAGVDQTVCATSPQVTLAGAFGGGASGAMWSGGAGMFSPSAAALNAVYTPSAAEIMAGTVTLTLTTNDPTGPCGAVLDTMTITINPAATVDANADQTVCASSPNVQLAGSFGGAATGATWTTSGTGTFSPNATTLNAVYQPSAADITAGTVTVTLTTNDPNGPCTQVADTMVVTINPAAVANAGSDVTVCSSTPAVVLAGSVSGGATSGTWSGGAGTFAPNAMALNATYTPSAAEITAGTVTLTLTTNDPLGPCGTVSDTVVITINPAVVVSAGANQIVCATSPAVTLAGSVTGGTTSGTWSGGTGTFAPNAATLNATYTPSVAEIAAGTVTLTLTSTDPNGPCGATSDTVTITINPAATVNAGADTTVCATSPSVTLGGSLGGSATSATWSGGTGTFVPNANTLNATYTPSAAELTAGTVTLTLTTNDPAGPCGAVNDTVVITINPAATVNAGAAQTVCATSGPVQLNGSIGGAATSATWSGGTGTFAPNATTLNATYTPSAADIAAGFVALTLTTNDPAGACGAVNATVVITINAAAVTNAGADQTVCAASPAVTLAGSITGATTSGTWSGGTGTFSPNATTLNAVYTPSAAEVAAGTVTLTLTSTDPPGVCGSVSDTLTITINPAASVNAGPDLAVCATSPTVALGGTFGGAATSATWSGGTGTFSPNANTLNATYTLSAAEVAAGTVTLTLTSNDPAGPCGTANDAVTISLSTLASVNAGADQNVSACASGAQLTGVIAGGATSATWTTSGTGTFTPNATTLNATYLPSAADKAAGSVTLTLTTNDPPGVCTAASDQVTITFTGCIDLSVTQTVNNPTPAYNSNVVFTITILNSGPLTATNVNVGEVLSTGLNFVSATVSQGSYNSATGVWTVGTLPVNGTATLLITATVTEEASGGAVSTAQVTAADQFDIDSTPNNNVPTEDDQASAFVVPPALPTTISNTKEGSMLIFNFYTSNSANPSAQNTRFNLTNTHDTRPVAVHLFFVDGASCSIADSYVCLTPRQTTSFLASDVDPDVTGYVIAIAVDCDLGCPIVFNNLIGDEFVKMSSGHRANLGAEAITASNIPACDVNTDSVTLAFDGVSYSRLPRTLAADSLASRVDGNDTFVVLNRLGGSLFTGLNRLSDVNGLLYNDQETVYSFGFNATTCQLRTSLSNNFPRTTPRYESIIPAGRTGWIKFATGSETNGGIIGSIINFNPNTNSSNAAFNGGRNMHKLTFSSTATMTMPVFPPNCC